VTSQTFIASAPLGAVPGDFGIARSPSTPRPPAPDAIEALRRELAATRDAIREADNLGATVTLAEEAWSSAGEALDAVDAENARMGLERASRLVTEARERRIREIGDHLSTVEDHIALARTVGANPDEAARILEDARGAYRSADYPRASDLLLRAERIAMLGQLGQIQKALELREVQTRRAFEAIAANEPVVQEAESYGMNVSEARVLLRQARDVLARGDYLTGLTFARNADEAVSRLLPRLEEERRRRGIEKPSRGMCGACRSTRLHFYENGWGRCLECGSTFRWRAAGLVETLRGLLGT
jgi:hypothetical protein